MSLPAPDNNPQQPPQSGTGEAMKGAHENVDAAKKSLGSATDSIKNLASGKANVVDTALAVKGAFDAVSGLTGQISASVMMPVMKALSAFKGQAILPAGKQMDPVLGIDVHMVTIPPSPAPVPLPHPYIGMLFNPKDWISCLINTFKQDVLNAVPEPKEGDKGIGASLANNKAAIAGIAMGLMGMSATIKFGGAIPRAVTGTATKSIPHIPMGAGFHPAFVATVAKNVGKAFLGSLFVSADGDPMVGCFHLNYDCWDVGVMDLFKSQRAGAKNAGAGDPLMELFVPSGTVMAIPWGRPVLVNSIPTPINPLSIADKLFKAALGKLAKAARSIAQKGLDKLNGKVGCGVLTAASKAIGTGQSHPVDVSSGHFYTDNIDFKLPGPIPFSWQRTWYSYSTYNGPLGHGWHHSYDMALAIDEATQKAIVRMSDGRVAHFDLPAMGAEVYNRSEKLTLYLHEEGYYYVSDVKGLLYRFTQSLVKNPFNNTETFLLQSIANRNGFAIRFFYNDKAVLTKIIDSSNRVIIVNSDDNGRIINIQLPDPKLLGRTTFAATTYHYSNEGDLIEQSDALNQAVKFEYRYHLIVREVWRNGCVWQFKYDKEKGNDAKCIEVWGTGNLLHYQFDYTDPACTIATNSRGFKKQFYHKNGVVIKYIDPLDAAWEYRYNQYNELEWETDPLGNQKTRTYDKWGNVNSITDANGASIQISYGYKFLKHSKVEVIDKSGGKWKWDYDEPGNLIKRTNPIKAVKRFYYDDGLLKAITNPSGSKTILEYDGFYNLNRMIAANGYEIKWNHDLLGRRISTIDSLGNTRKIEFNLLALPETIYEPDGNVKYLKFDGESNVICVKDNKSNTFYNYNFLNKIISKRQGKFGITFKYDTESNLIKVINQHNETYTFEIDAADQIIKEIGFDESTREYIRDSAGRVIHIKRPDEKFTKIEYNETGKITEVKYHDSTFEKYNYNNAGLLIEGENKNSKIIFEKDILGRITKEINGEKFINCEYDLSNNRTLITSSFNINIENEFNEIGNVIKTKSEQWAGSFDYNEFSLEVERKLPGNISCIWSRDKLGRSIKQRIQNNNFDIQTRQYAWDINYKLKRITDSIKGVTNFFYDEEGHLTKTVFSDGEEQIRDYDGVGNVFKTTEKLESIYGKGEKLIKSKAWNYEYNEEGNLIKKYKQARPESKEELWQYYWNANGTLQSVQRPDKTIVSFTYDVFGRRLSKQYKNTTTKWLWDKNKPVHEWKENALTGEIINNNENKNDITTWLFNEQNFVPVAKLRGDKVCSIISDHIGTPFQMYNNNGEKLWELQLDSYGKTRMLKGDENSCPFRYQGQYEDVETGLYYNRFRYYNPDDGRYLSQDPIRFRSGQPNFYSHVRDTNIEVDLLGLEEDGLSGQGGSYGDVKRDTKNTGVDVHHMPSDQANSDNGIARNDGPAISMDPADHQKTASYGGGGDDYRSQQSDHIANGRYDLAMGMDIRDVNTIAPGKYTQAMLEAIEHAEDAGYITAKQAANLRALCKEG